MYNKLGRIDPKIMPDIRSELLGVPTKICMIPVLTKLMKPLAELLNNDDIFSKVNSVTGEGADDVARNDKNLVIKAMYKGFEFLGGKPRGIALRQLNVIPHGRGLGSSASAIVGGLSLARALVLGGNERMSHEDMLNIDNEMEGHPDNVAAALYGGATVAWQDEVKSKIFAHALHLPVDPRIKVMAFIPSTPLATKKARTMLPDFIPFADAQRNSTNTAIMMQALTIRPDLLLTATEDFLHQSYRQEAMPASYALMNKLRAAGVAAFISGAGPTVLALHTGDQEESEQLARAGGAKFEGKSLEIASRGATLL